MELLLWPRDYMKQLVEKASGAANYLCPFALIGKMHKSLNNVLPSSTISHWKQEKQQQNFSINNFRVIFTKSFIYLIKIT